MQFDCGYLSPYFVTDRERIEVIFENVYVLIHEKKISSEKELLPLLEQITKIGKPLLIVAEDVGGEALAALVVHKLGGPTAICCRQGTGLRGSAQQYVAGNCAPHGFSKTITKGIDIELKNTQISDLGHAGKVTLDKNNHVSRRQAQVRTAFL